MKTLTVKFTIGDIVWFMHENKCKSTEILAIRIYKNRPPCADTKHHKHLISFDQLFASADECIKSITIE